MYDSEIFAEILNKASMGDFNKTPERNKKIEYMYMRILEMIEERCNDEIKDLIAKLDRLAVDLMSNSFDTGVVKGIALSNDLRFILKEPQMAYKAFLESKIPLSSSHKEIFEITHI